MTEGRSKRKRQRDRENPHSHGFVFRIHTSLMISLRESSEKRTSIKQLNRVDVILFPKSNRSISSLKEI